MLHKKTEQNLRERGVTMTRSVQPRIGISLIEIATMEDRDNLHTKWANMLTNAMDPHYKPDIKNQHIRILEQLEPIDTKILEAMYEIPCKYPPQKKIDGVLYERSKIAQELSIDITVCELSFRNLIRLGCLKPGVVIGSASIGGHPLSAYKDTEMVGLTLSGLEFYKAISSKPTGKTCL